MPSSSPDLYFELTPRLHAACRMCIRVLPKNCERPKEIADISKWKDNSKNSKASATKAISLSAIKTLSQLLRAHGKDKDTKEGFWVHQLLRESRIHIENPLRKPRDPALDARLDAIRRQLDEHEYRKMTANVTSFPSVSTENDKKSTAGSYAETMFPAVPGVRVGQSMGLATVRQDMKAANQQITVIINILFSALGVGFAVAYASYTLTDEIGWRVLLGLSAAVVMILAETWLFFFSATRGQKKRIQLSSFKLAGSSMSSREALAKKEL
ncbi:hypothetical protein GGI11_000394 [Coemansia sp. RSA 2049]|nr:hypothetical protein GGI11_000394 [Coemansia sp. RSA 2049]